MNKLQEMLIAAIPKEALTFAEDTLWCWDPFPNYKWYGILRFSKNQIDFVNATKESTSLEELLTMVQSIPEDIHDQASGVWFPVPGESRFGGVIIDKNVKMSPMGKTTNWVSSQMWILRFAHRCEVALNQTEQETRARKRLWRPVDLKREISPFTRSRLLYAKRKIRAGGAGKTRGVTHWPNLIQSFKTLAEDDGFLEVENYEREVARFDHEGGYTLSFRDAEYELSPKAAEGWLNTFAKEGADAAAKELT